MPAERDAHEETRMSMTMRSLLFVPGDRPERFEKAATSGADAIIIDLEDSVGLANKEKARDALAGYGAGRRSKTLFVRVNPLTSEHFAQDLRAVRESKPDGVVLPKCEGAESVELCADRLKGSGCSEIPILPIATETPSAIFKLGSFERVRRLICGLTWGAEDLPAAIGAVTSRELDGRYTAPYEVVRSLALFAAHAAGVQAIETVYPGMRDLDGLKSYAERGRRDGFTGMMAIHPNQVPVINAAFTPGEEEVARAEAIIAAFEAEPGIGVIELDGRMLDLPHLKSARSVLASATRRR